MKRLVAAAAAAVTALAGLGAVAYKAYRYRHDAQQWHGEWLKLHRDPGGHQRYQEDNARLRATPTNMGGQVPGRVVFLGASITEALHLRETFPREDFVNRGQGGQLVWQQLLRLEPDALDLHPEAVVIKMCAINLLDDAPSFEETQRYYALLASSIRQRNVKVILATTVPVTRDWNRRYGGGVTRSIVRFNEWVRAQARDHHDVLLDYASALSDEEGFLPDNLSDDGLHPNADGTRRMLATIRSTLIEGRIPETAAPSQGEAPAPQATGDAGPSGATGTNGSPTR